MGFRLANAEGRAVLVLGDNYYGLEKLSGGTIGSDPMDAFGAVETLGTITNRCVRVADHPRADVVPAPIKKAMASKGPF